MDLLRQIVSFFHRLPLRRQSLQLKRKQSGAVFESTVKSWSSH